MKIVCTQGGTRYVSISFINPTVLEQVPLEQIQARVILLKKLISALKEAQASGVRRPLDLLKRTLKEKAKLQIEKSHHNKPHH